MTRTLNKALLTSSPADAGRWRAVVSRDKSRSDFVYSVATTGVYCRPSCASRLPNRQNVAFHDNASLAEAQGFRPCKRCKPDQAAFDARQRDVRLVEEACRQISEAEAPPNLNELAGQSGLSPFHFHRIFKSVTGMTPKAYDIAQRRNLMRGALQKSSSVTQAAYEAGYNSSAGFYADAEKSLGMSPKAYRSGGRGETIKFAFGKSWAGPVLVAASPKGICAILIGEDQSALLDDLKKRFPKAALSEAAKDFANVVQQVIKLVERPDTTFDLPLDIRGTAFQHLVWQALQAIPSGSTATYADIAAKIGKPKAVRAVGSACGANPVAIAVPCHRVLRHDGSLSGYRWGPHIKQELLTREAARKRR